MNDEIRFSIVTPTYNSERTVKRTFDSILCQTYNNIEYIVIDGKSQDNTQKIIEDYIPKFKERGIQIKYISEKDEGIADAFNKGVSLATGDLVGIINSDDWFESNTLKIISENYHKKYKIYCGDLNLFEHNKFLRKKKSRIYLLWLGMYVMHPTTFVSSEIYNRFYFDKKLNIAMDYDFILKVSKDKKNKIKYIPKVLANMEVGGVSSDLAKMKVEEMKVIKRHTPVFLFYFVSFYKKVLYFLYENVYVNMKKRIINNY